MKKVNQKRKKRDRVDLVVLFTRSSLFINWEWDDRLWASREPLNLPAQADFSGRLCEMVSLTLTDGAEDTLEL